jgi:ribosomal-protein-alanine N-acetyltransferase
MKNSGKVIGGCGFNFTENDEVIELIYHFARDYWGKGFAYEAGKVAMKFISDNKKFKKVIASVLLENKSSENILKNIGFKFVEMKWFDDSQCFEPYYEYIFDEKISTIKT